MEALRPAELMQNGDSCGHAHNGGVKLLLLVRASGEMQIPSPALSSFMSTFIGRYPLDLTMPEHYCVQFAHALVPLHLRRSKLPVYPAYA